jgi:hypothetical protein
MTTTSRPVNERDRETHQRMAHYTTEGLAGNAATLIALSNGDPDPMTPFQCRVCGDWCLTYSEGPAPSQRPYRHPIGVRKREVAAERAVELAAAAAYWDAL